MHPRSGAFSAHATRSICGSPRELPLLTGPHARRVPPLRPGTAWPPPFSAGTPCLSQSAHVVLSTPPNGEGCGVVSTRALATRLRGAHRPAAPPLSTLRAALPRRLLPLARHVVTAPRGFRRRATSWGCSPVAERFGFFVALFVSAWASGPLRVRMLRSRARSSRGERRRHCYTTARGRRGRIGI